MISGGFTFAHWIKNKFLDEVQNSPQSIPFLLFKLYFPVLPPHFLCSEQYTGMLLGTEARSVLLTAFGVLAPPPPAGAS